MTGDEHAREAEEPIHLEAHVSGGSVYQAGRDQHVHFGTATRVENGTVQEVCPYPGLAAFEPEQARWFFGRERILAEVTQRLADKLRDGGPLLIIGPSGAGKSSLVQAGVGQMLDRGALPVEGSRHWPRLVLAPTERPVSALAEKMRELTGQAPEDARDAWVAEPGRCAEALRRALSGPTRAIVIVDQFEETFTLCADKRERESFMAALDTIATAAGGRLAALVMICLRADFYEQSMRYPAMRAWLRDYPVLLEPMSANELREAIVCPAQDVGLDTESGLVELLLRDIGVRDGDSDAKRAGRLPLLAHALRVTWQQREGHLLTVHGYQVSGGIDNAIATTAERAFGALSRPGQDLARSLFLRLVKIGENADDTCRRMDRHDLSRDLDAGRAGEVLSAFTRARLLTWDRDTVMITHEALLRAWPRLRDWVNADRAGQLIRQDVQEAADAWDRDNRESSALYRGSRLEAARAWASQHDPDISALAREFLQASARQRRRTTLLRRGAVIALAVLTAGTSAASVLAVQQRSSALQERDQAVYTQTMAEGQALDTTNTSLAAQLDLVAYRMGGPDQNILESRLISTENSALASTLTLRPAVGIVKTVAYQPGHGHLLASGGSDGYVRLWNVTSQENPTPIGSPLLVPTPRRGQLDVVQTVTFSQDGDVLAAGNRQGTIQFWDVTDPAHPRPLARLDVGSPIESLAYSPHGGVLASGSDDALIRLWDVTDPARPSLLGRPLAGDKSSVLSVAFSPDGHTLASGNYDDTILLWNVTRPARATLLDRPPVEHTEPVNSVAFSPDGQILASGSEDRTVVLWDVANPARTSFIKSLTGHTDAVMSVAFSPDGQILAAGSSDSTVRLWDMAGPYYPQMGPPLASVVGIVNSVAFSPDGHTIATGDNLHAVGLWSLPRTVLPGHSDSVLSTAFSPDGRTMATCGYDGMLFLWNVGDPADPRPLYHASTGAWLSSVAFSAYDHLLAIGTKEEQVVLLDVADPSHPRWLGVFTAGHGSVQSVAFSPDGHILAAGTGDGAVWIWNVTNPVHPTLLSTTVVPAASSVNSVAFSPRGRLLAEGDDSYDVRLWDVTNPAHPVQVGQPLTGHHEVVMSVAFSPGGRTLASASDDQTVRLWNVTDPRHASPLGQPLAVHTSPVYSVAFSDHGHLLASGSGDNTVGLWNVADPGQPVFVGQLTGHTNNVFTVAFDPRNEILASAGSDETVQLSDPDVNVAIQRICAISRNALTVSAWRTYVSRQLPYDPPCRS